MMSVGQVMIAVLRFLLLATMTTTTCVQGQRMVGQNAMRGGNGVNSNDNKDPLVRGDGSMMMMTTTQPPLDGRDFKDRSTDHLKEMLHRRGIQFDKDAVTPEELKDLIRKHRLKPPPAGVGGSSSLPSKQQKIKSLHEARLAMKKKSGDDRAMRGTASPPGRFHRDDAAERRRVLERLKKEHGISPRAALSLEQLKKIEKSAQNRKAKTEGEL